MSSRTRSSGAWRNAPRYERGRGSVKTWLLSIVHHRAVDAVRRRRPTVELPDREDIPPAGLTLPDLWPEVAAGLDRDAVRAALASLSDVQREAIELAYFGGLTQQEIAARTNTPLGTVKSRMRLGLLAMRRTLLGDGSVSGDAGRCVARRTEDADDLRRRPRPGRRVRPRGADAGRGAGGPRASRRPAPRRTTSSPSSAGSCRRSPRSVEPVEPPPALRERILAAAAADLRERGAAPVAGRRRRRRRRSRRPRRRRSRPRQSCRSGRPPPDRGYRATAGRSASRRPSSSPPSGVWNVRLQGQLNDAQAYQAAGRPGARDRPDAGRASWRCSRPAAAGGQDGLVADRPRTARRRWS